MLLKSDHTLTLSSRSKSFSTGSSIPCRDYYLYRNHNVFTPSIFLSPTSSILSKWCWNWFLGYCELLYSTTFSPLGMCQTQYSRQLRMLMLTTNHDLLPPLAQRAYCTSSTIQSRLSNHRSMLEECMSLYPVPEVRCQRCRQGQWLIKISSLLPFDWRQHDKEYHGWTLALLLGLHTRSTHSAAYKEKGSIRRVRQWGHFEDHYLCIPKMGAHEVGNLSELDGQYFMHFRMVQSFGAGKPENCRVQKIGTALPHISWRSNFYSFANGNTMKWYLLRYLQYLHIYRLGQNCGPNPVWWWWGIDPRWWYFTTRIIRGSWKVVIPLISHSLQCIQRTMPLAPITIRIHIQS